ncbi:MAG: enoyl-CoA hydratase/isomerase [Pseudomonadota bacterium]
MTFEKITYSVDADIATLTLNDPSSMNAAGTDMVSELLKAIQFAGEDARCTIITGTGRGFSSGANLSSGSMSGTEKTGVQRKTSNDLGRALDVHYNPFIIAMRDHPHPIITAVNGAAAGIGCSIALMGDLIVCSESAYFLQAFRRIGLVPDGGSTWLLPRAIGRVRAMEMTLLGDKLPAAKALEWGMVNRVVPDGDLMTTAQDLAARLASGPTFALAGTRRLIWDSQEDNLDYALRSERLEQREAGRTQDFREGLKAFKQKRPAEFTGQ